MNRIIAWLPDRVDVRLKVIAWIYLVGQIILVGTGGLVRLTSSGLGCPTWPKCTADSLVNTPEMGIHGVIEFGNRLLGVLLGIVAIVAFVAILRLRKERPDLFWLTLLAGLGIPAQAVIGGLSVLTDLNPYVVGLHFVVSIVLVALCTTFLFRLYTTPGPRMRAVPAWFAIVTHITSFVVAVTILVGILTTGSGPHAGDAKAPRNNLNPEILQHVHAIPAYVTFALTLVLVIASLRFTATKVRRYAALLLVVELVQIAVGLIQANTGLPGVLVGVHMMLAASLAAAMTAVVLSLKAPVAGNAAADATSVERGAAVA
ncbi:COX15/CtaA family protein [Leifsonia sp. PS1209]|uniref:COX15/CtaA family protein n=1 Tax=Leifsonia sp. PS1209 TaxID=2724914 RepID=UPI001442B216|nr:COX15/CtaA family protein [Leifsonia sp. PS1209]QIZ98861.1 heme A synthase [Leifsonia sp. PS1209]